MNTPSLESMAEVMSCIKQCCDFGHRLTEKELMLGLRGI
jgi:hypothetical protein